MSWLRTDLLDEVEDAHVRVFYVSGLAAALWAKEKDPDQPRVFCGFYWAVGAREGGPFRSRSAAIRDAWYRVVREDTPPNVRARNEKFERGRNALPPQVSVPGSRTRIDKAKVPRTRTRTRTLKVQPQAHVQAGAPA